MKSNRRTAQRKPLVRKIRRFMRRHFFNKRAAQGSVTVFLIIIMLPMLIFSCSIIDVCKIYMAKNTTDSALELAMNSRLASYDDILKDMYGILASSADEEELSEKLATYYAMTLESSTGSKIKKDEKKYMENFFSKLLSTDVSNLDGNGLLNLYEDSNAKFSVTPVATSSVTNPEVMHKQIVEYMKYRGPVYLATGGLDTITAFTDVSNQSKAAKAQLDYEEKLSDAGKVFEDAYNNINGLLTDANTLQGNNYTAFANCYEAGYGFITVPKEYIDELAESVEAAYVCSFFGGAFDEDGDLSFVDSARDAFNMDEGSCEDESSAYINLESALETMIGIDERARDTVDFFLTYDSAGDFIKSSDVNAVNYLINDFGIIFKGVKSVKRKGNDVTDVITLFEAYNNARYYSDDLARKIEKAPDDRKPLLKEKKDELDKLIGKADDVVWAIESAAYVIERFMEDQYDVAKEKYNSAVVKLSEEYAIVSAQYERLEWLLSSKGIDNIVKEMEDVAKKADTFRTSIEGGKSVEGKSFNGVKTTSEKAAMMETYNSGAAEMVGIAGNISGSTDSINALKGILGVLKDAYKAEMDSLNSITYFGNKLSDSFKSNKELKLSHCLAKYCEEKKNEAVNSWYNFSKYKQSDFLSYEKFSGVNLVKWNSKNGEITGNEFYKVVEKYGKSSKAVNKDAEANAKSAKNSITDYGKKAGNSSGNGDAQNDEKLKEEVKVAKFIPANYPVYSLYLGNLENAWKGDHGGDAMLDMIDSQDWFSLEASNNGDAGKIPGNYNTGGSSDGDIAKNAGSMLDSVGNFFGDLLAATRDNLYIAEYLTENFPCFTTLLDDPSAAMISGIKFKESGKANVVCSVSSLEYILYGDMDSTSDKESGASVAKASAVLFGVRFALNLIYALTSPTLAGQVEPIVAPLEAIPFAGPIARTVILIGLALGESGIDISLLLAGQEVAVFKNDMTWVCSPYGFLQKLGKTAADAAADKLDDVAVMLIDEATDKVNEGLSKAEEDLVICLTEKADDVDTKANAWVEEKLKSMRESIENDVWNPIVTTINSYIENFKNTQITPEVSDIEKKLDEIFGDNSVTRKNLGLTDPDAKNDALKSVEIEVFNFLKNNKGALAQEIYNHLDKFIKTAQNEMAGVAEQAVEKLDNQIKGFLTTVETAINDKFDEARAGITEKLKMAIEEFGNDLQEKTENVVNNTSEKAKKKARTMFSEKTNEKVRGQKPESKKVDLSKGSNGSDGKLIADKGDKQKDKDSSLKIAYKDYMYVFTVLGLIMNEDNMLMRASQLMNANIELRIGDKTTRTEKPKNAYNSDVPYNMNKAYTLFKGEAGSKTRTMFLGTSWNNEKQTWIRPASNVYSYKATTYVGY